MGNFDYDAFIRRKCEEKWKRDLQSARALFTKDRFMNPWIRSRANLVKG